MSVSKESNKKNINEKVIQFNNTVDTILEFPQYCIILLMDNDIPDNNVVAIDYNGNRVWNISQIIKFQYLESYISLSKEADNLFSVVTYNGVRYVVDTITNQIVNKNITK